MRELARCKAKPKDRIKSRFGPGAFHDEVYAEARHLLGPLIDALDEGEVVHSRDSGLVDYSQSGGD